MIDKLTIAVHAFAGRIYIYIYTYISVRVWSIADKIF